MRNLIKYLKPYKKQCVIGPICKLAEAIFELLLPTIMAFVIDNGVTKHNSQVVVQLTLLMLIMVIIGFVCSMTCQYQAALASQGFGTNLRNCLFQHIANFSYQDIDCFGTSSLTNRLTNDINQLQVAVAMLIRLVIRAPFIVIGALIMAFILDTSTAFILLATIPFIIIILYFFIKKSTPLYRMYQRKLDHFATILDDNFAGIRVIRSFVSQRSEKNRFHKASDDLQVQMMSVAHLSALLNPASAFIVNGAIILLLWQGITRIQGGNIAPGVIIALINYATQILLALVAISNLIVIFSKASASAQRVNEVLQHQPSLRPGNVSTQVPASGTITFEQVSFSYGSGEYALHNLTFHITEGETIGIIGSTGSGKSTLVHLMCRFYDPVEGIITLANRPISDYSFQALQKWIGIVPQMNELFTATIRDNLTLGKSISETELNQAIQDAQAEEFIQTLPKGIDTMLERGGANLSGGQKQRLCIARGLLTNASILILDDASSALDYKTEAAVRHALQLRKQVTKIIISQRVSTLMGSDRIMVLNDGEIVGFQHHTALYKSCSVYQELCQSQNIGGTL